MTTTLATPDALVTQAHARLTGTTPDRVECRDLARWLGSASEPLVLPPFAPGERTVLARHHDGPVLVLADLAPDVPTEIHGHGTWGVGVLLAGSGRYERWQPAGPDTARLVEFTELVAGDVLSVMPSEVHRKRAGERGARELLLLGTDPCTPTTYRPGSAGLGDLIVDCFDRGDTATLTAAYHPRALLDENVPQWRRQLTGRSAIGGALATELEVPGRRVTWLRRTDTADGVLVENEVRYADSDGEGLWRNAHLFGFAGDVGGESIVEHTVWCTGLWDPATIVRQAVEAPMVWR